MGKDERQGISGKAGKEEKEMLDRKEWKRCGEMHYVKDRHVFVRTNFFTTGPHVSCLCCSRQIRARQTLEQLHALHVIAIAICEVIICVCTIRACSLSDVI